MTVIIYAGINNSIGAAFGVTGILVIRGFGSERQARRKGIGPLILNAYIFLFAMTLIVTLTPKNLERLIGTGFVPQVIAENQETFFPKKGFFHGSDSLNFYSRQSLRAITLHDSKSKHQIEDLVKNSTGDEPLWKRISAKRFPFYFEFFWRVDRALHAKRSLEGKTEAAKERLLLERRWKGEACILNVWYSNSLQALNLLKFDGANEILNAGTDGCSNYTSLEHVHLELSPSTPFSLFAWLMLAAITCYLAWMLVKKRNSI